MEFLKSSELSLNPAGYLVATIGKSDKPVTHAEFVNQQRAAEYIVKLAAALKGKTFKASKLDDLEAIKREVKAAMTTDVRTYVSAPTKPTSKVNDEMVEFALNFAKFEDEKGKAAQINAFMQSFNKIADVENVGEYFSEGVVKLAKIYTIAEIQAAVEANISVLA